jgi:hemerythrin superfamily protein
MEQVFANGIGQTADSLLENDHNDLDKLLGALITSFGDAEPASVFKQLDLFWARLAIHIRAEHLHLFPAIINHLREVDSLSEETPSLSEAESVVQQLRHDHEFFMRTLSDAIREIRGLTQQNQHGLDEALERTARMIAEIEKRLVTHNELEEGQIYRWVGKILSEPEKLRLAKLVRAELENLPPRFEMK